MLPVLLAQSSQILGLFKDVKQISELQVAFEKIAKNLTKFASKNLGVRKLNFPSVCTHTIIRAVLLGYNCFVFEINSSRMTKLAVTISTRKVFLLIQPLFCDHLFNLKN